MEFTAHNIRFSDGSQTIKGKPLLADTGLSKAILRTLDLSFGNRDKSQIRIADLGCLEGGYTAELARQGYNSLGIEVRDDNIKKCQYASKKLNLPNLKFVQDDVRNVAKHGKFDAVVCLGLLYHLDNPVAFLKLIGEQTRRTLVLDTHYAYSSNWLIRKTRIKLNPFIKIVSSQKETFANYHLSRLTSHEGKNGRWFPEFADTMAENDMNKLLWASYKNPRSFWLTKPDLLQAVQDGGFELVYEQFDHQDSISKSRYSALHDRGLFVGVKKTSNRGIENGTT